eukprot:254537_1
MVKIVEDDSVEIVVVPGNAPIFDELPFRPRRSVEGRERPIPRDNPRAPPTSPPAHPGVSPRQKREMPPPQPANTSKDPLQAEMTALTAHVVRLMRDTRTFSEVKRLESEVRVQKQQMRRAKFDADILAAKVIVLEEEKMKAAKRHEEEKKKEAKRHEALRRVARFAHEQICAERAARRAE